jgi:hypothetical protein
VTVPQHDFGGMQHVCGIKSRGRAIARRGDHEPDEQMNGPAHGGRRHAKEVCRQLKELRQSNGGSNLRLVRYGIVFGAGKAVTAVTQAAAVVSSFESSLWFQRLFAGKLAGDRGADSIAATMLRA